jgi:hypothetical protein
VEDILPKLFNAIQLRETEGVALFEVRGNESSLLYNDECVLDFQSKWKKEKVKEEVKEKSAKKGFFASLFGKGDDKKEEKTAPVNTGVPRFLLKRRIFNAKTQETTDPVNQKLIYFQFIRDLVCGNFQVELDAAATLMAMHQIIEDSKTIKAIGPLPPLTSEGSHDTFASLDFRKVPPNLAVGKNKVDQVKWQKLVEKATKEVKSASIETLLTEAAAKIGTFGSSFYTLANLSEDRTFPASLFLAINIHGVFFLEKHTKLLYEHAALINVPGWAYTPVLLLIKVKFKDKKGQVTTFHFETPSPRVGKEVCDYLLLMSKEMLKAIKKG